jgi:hypothetical protein
MAQRHRDRDSDTFIRAVRAAIAEWKEEQLDETVKEDQDTRKLNDYLKLTAFAYEMVKEYLASNGTSQVDPLLTTILATIGDVSRVNRDEQRLLHEYLFRDLIEYPFTYNARLINSFEAKDVLHTNIIPNK